MVDDFCRFFDSMKVKYTLKTNAKRKYHRDSMMYKAEVVPIIILSHASGYRCLLHVPQEAVYQCVKESLMRFCFILIHRIYFIPLNKTYICKRRRVLLLF